MANIAYPRREKALVVDDTFYLGRWIRSDIPRWMCSSSGILTVNTYGQSIFALQTSGTALLLL